MITLNSEYLDRYIKSAELDEMLSTEAKVAYRKVIDGTGAGADIGLGWVNQPTAFDAVELAKIKQAAATIRQNFDTLVVVGIGGSYLGAKAVIELLQPFNDQLEVIFAGKDLDTVAAAELLRRLDGKNWAINVVSKSGTTTEPALALRILRSMLSKKYGAEADQRIYATTDASKGTLHDLAVERGWERFVVPDDIGGRYSVLSAVGLLPIAAAGIDIDQLLQGAAEQASDNGAAIQYAAVRNLLYRKNFSVEILGDFSSKFCYLNEWWKQLFGESEGKNNQALWPASVIYSTDLHSLGQYIQDGRRIGFETMIKVEQAPDGVVVPPLDDDDGVGYLAGKSLADINRVVFVAAAQAHHDAAHGGVPVVVLSMPEISAAEVGALLYFMMMACAVSAYILDPDGNPFDQPGVEFYKNNAFKLLGKK
jgi:glucose-6-phosphate isomerase